MLLSIFVDKQRRFGAGAGVFSAVNLTFHHDTIAPGVGAGCTALLTLDSFMFKVLKHCDYENAATTAVQ